VLVEYLHRFLAVPGFIHAVARAHQCLSEELSNRRLILYQ
jgi:hypothetical protein